MHVRSGTLGNSTIRTNLERRLSLSHFNIKLNLSLNPLHLPFYDIMSELS